jgi:hypothetical protein
MEEERTVDNTWKNIKDAFLTTCQETLGQTQQQHKEWISGGTFREIQERKEKKARLNSSRTCAGKAAAQEAYKAANKKVKKKIREDKRRFVENLATEAEEAAGKRNLKELYDLTKKMSGKFGKPERPVRDKDGNSIPGTAKQKQRWVEYVSELLNRPAPTNPPNLEPAEQDLQIGCDAPSKEEIRKAIGQLRNGKAAGPDHIPAEALKADVETTVNILHPLFQHIWEEEHIPEEWKEGHLIKLPKKGDLSDCGNYRGIMLLSTIWKVFNRVILNRMKGQVDKELRDQQAGFRKERSCTDQIATLRIII